MKGPTEGLPWTALAEMERYYTDRVPWHDGYMGYEGNEAMEDLLAPIIEHLEDRIAGRDVLEVACGSGNWTQVLSSRARSVTATDLIPGYLELARGKSYPKGNVVFQVADAYVLETIDGCHDAGFASDWWSHIPRSMYDAFLVSLHGRLAPGSYVVLVDMLRTDSFDLAYHRTDTEGNEIHLRTLPNGESYSVIKNFPEEEELLGWLEGWARDIEYREFPGLGRWVLAYRVRR